MVSELEASKLKVDEGVCDYEGQVKIGLGFRLISLGQDSILFSQVLCQGARENWLMRVILRGKLGGGGLFCGR